MAGNIDINSVYTAVLVVLEQEKRGVLMPTQFNKIATQCQQEIFTEYFDELNLILRQPQTSLAYADRLNMLDEKIQLFKRVSEIPIGTTGDTLDKVTIPGTTQELGTVVFKKNTTTAGRELQRIQPFEVFTTNESPLTAPTEFYPVYLYENGVLQVFPTGLSTGAQNSGTAKDLQVNFLEFPADVKWGFKIDPELGNFVYNPLDSVQFTLPKSDQPLLVSKILGYAGVMTKDQFAMSIANQKEQQINANSNK
jgi:hypothetical protein